MENTGPHKTFMRDIILKEYADGRRYFTDLDLTDENFDDQDLHNAVFENCCLDGCSFQRANLECVKMIHGSIKCSDFRFANLTHAHFEGLAVESTLYTGAELDGFFFHSNYSYGATLYQEDFDNWLKHQSE